MLSPEADGKMAKAGLLPHQQTNPENGKMKAIKLTNSKPVCAECHNDRIAQKKRETIAQAFKEAHSYDLEAWGISLDAIYRNITGGIYGAVERCDMGDGVTNYTIEISSSDSKTGAATIFDIDLDDDLIADLGWK